MKKADLDLYTDYLLSTFGAAANSFFNFCDMCMRLFCQRQLSTLDERSITKMQGPNLKIVEVPIAGS